jgi:hypothetical protein
VKGSSWLAAAIGTVFVAPCAVGESPTQASLEHAVVVHFSYGSSDFARLSKLEQKLKEAIIEAEVGEFDSAEVAADGSHGYLYMYGPDGDRIYQVIEPFLLDTSFMRGATVKIRYGRPTEDAREREIAIAP